MRENYDTFKAFLLDDDVAEQLGDRATFKTVKAAMTNILAVNDELHLLLELAIARDAVQEVCLACYKLEGDGALLFEAYDVLQHVRGTLASPSWTEVNNLAAAHAGNAGIPHADSVQYAIACIQPVRDYFSGVLDDDRNHFSLVKSKALFRSARYLNPRVMAPLVADDPPGSAVDIDDMLSGFPDGFLTAAAAQQLREQRVRYIAKLRDHPDVPADDNNPEGNFRASGICKWWYARRMAGIDAWRDLFKRLLVIQPNSAAVERLFSMVKSTLEEQQQGVLADLVNVYAMGRYNHRQ